MQRNNMFYAPTYLELKAQQTAVPRPYKALSRPRKGKGKRVQRHDAELELEIRWVQEKLEEDEVRRATEVVQEAGPQETEEEGGIECGCCFTEYPFVRSHVVSKVLTANAPSASHRTRWCSARRPISSARPA